VDRLVVNVGDVLEIERRLYDVVPHKQGRDARTRDHDEHGRDLAAHGKRALTSEEFEAYFGDLPSDGEG
jgi:hypothetical protein